MVKLLICLAKADKKQLMGALTFKKFLLWSLHTAARCLSALSWWKLTWRCPLEKVSGATRGKLTTAGLRHGLKCTGEVSPTYSSDEPVSQNGKDVTASSSVLPRRVVLICFGRAQQQGSGKEQRAALHNCCHTTAQPASLWLHWSIIHSECEKQL